MDNELNYIELFAGCGGLSLGLKAAGFKLNFANELSPMAAETYAYNILNEDLKTEKHPTKTLWLNSQFGVGDIARLRENPHIVPAKSNNDLHDNLDLSGKLVVGDINALIDHLKKNPGLIDKFKNRIDLVSGGPPCQSFSLAGRREKNNKRNKLPWAFVEIVELVKPKLVLLENVSGILRAFKEGDHKYYAWFEVAKAFGQIGYVPICMHINAKYFGLPQSRPRFILLGIRSDLTSYFNNDHVFELSKKFISQLNAVGENLQLSKVQDFKYFELNKKNDIPFFQDSLLLPSPKFINDEDFLNVKQGIDILKNLENNFDVKTIQEDSFHKILENTFGKFNLRKEILVKNHNHRAHSAKIQNRFRLLRIIEEFENGTKVKLNRSIKSGSIDGLNNEIREKIKSKIGGINNDTQLADFFLKYKSKKHSQRALNANLPAPATLSIPDDVCHYDDEQNRTLTIREMARIQSFPDWFEFRSKDTTGGKNRRIEVPNYTQVGNAVPPLLGKALGDWLRIILDKINHEV